MSSHNAQLSKGTLKYFPQPVNQKCHSCEELSKKFDLCKDAAQKQYNTLLDILAEHKVLLDRIVAQNAVCSNIMGIFPINTEEKLKEFDTILATQADPYIRQIKLLLGGNAERNLHQVFGHGIIMNFNVDGSFGKKRLRDYGNVFTAIIGNLLTEGLKTVTHNLCPF
ncbi:uncharacterized protein LOC118749560 isoform X2 [Rhagoletis pomonella]|uniref:uncharacterized protein LOC118749560 isoform X2 n=1 Tax=Rhagoletis pomonella TaxID=28610 RepID=UPI00177D93C5|nr:uncharacterized protein LOC118749560 isoform X2 [Rhagoletis pomonella]